jgi:hypothetical protein
VAQTNGKDDGRRHSFCLPHAGDKNPTICADFLRRYKDEIHLCGAVLGDKATRTAEEYCAYLDRKMNQVTAVTAAIPANKRPGVYYITGRKVFATQDGNTTGHWLIEMAGGTHVSKDLGNYFAGVSIEQIIEWNPDVIIVGGMLPVEKSIKAVKENRAYPCPDGYFSRAMVAASCPCSSCGLPKPSTQINSRRRALIFKILPLHTQRYRRSAHYRKVTSHGMILCQFTF